MMADRPWSSGHSVPPATAAPAAAPWRHEASAVPFAWPTTIAALPQQRERTPGLFARWRMGHIRTQPAHALQSTFLEQLLAGCVTSFEIVACRMGPAAASIRCLFTLRHRSDVVLHEAPLRAPVVCFASAGTELQLLHGEEGWAAMHSSFRLTFLPCLLQGELRS